MSNQYNTENRIAKRIVAAFPGMFGRTYVREVASLHFALPDAEILELNNRGVGFNMCAACGEVHASPLETYIESSGVYICDNCKPTTIKPCPQCGRPMVHGDDVTGGHHYYFPVITLKHEHIFVCPDCANSVYHKCGVCGQRVYGSTMKVTDTKTVCASCYSDYIKDKLVCSSCGGLHKKEIMIEGLCPPCYKIKIQRSVVSPSKPTPQYHKLDPKAFLSAEEYADRYFGLELEASNGRSPSNQPKSLLQALYPWKELEISTDGSVGDGLEFVFYPMSLKYAKTVANLHSFCGILNDNDFKSHDDSRCGLHVHINRNSFGDSPRKRSRALAIFTYLIDRNDFRTEWKQFNRRKTYEYCHWYDIDWNEGTLAKGYNRCVTRNGRDRYRVVNYQNGGEHTIGKRGTVEVRMFQGTTKASTLIATLEMLNVICNLSTKGMKDAEARALTWAGVCAAVPADYTALKEYLMKRNIWRV